MQKKVELVMSQVIEKKEGIFPNMSIYENMVLPLYKGEKAKTSGGF